MEAVATGLQTVLMSVGCPHCTKNVELTVIVNHPKKEQHDILVPPNDDTNEESVLSKDVPPDESPGPIDEQDRQSVKSTDQSSNTMYLEEVNIPKEIESIVQGHAVPPSVEYCEPEMKEEASDDLNEGEDECIFIKEEPGEFPENQGQNYQDNQWQGEQNEWTQTPFSAASLLQHATPEPMSAMPQHSFPRKNFGMNALAARNRMRMRGSFRRRGPSASFIPGQKRPLPSSSIASPNISPQRPQISPMTRRPREPQQPPMENMTYDTSEMTFSENVQYEDQSSNTSFDNSVAQAFSNVQDQMMGSVQTMNVDRGGDAGEAGADKGLGAGPFICKFCGKSSALKYNLLSHIRAVHLQEKDFECDLCHRRFLHRGNLNRHKCTVAPFACFLCRKNFMTEQDRIQHLCSSSSNIQS